MLNPSLQFRHCEPAQRLGEAIQVLHGSLKPGLLRPNAARARNDETATTAPRNIYFTAIGPLGGLIFINAPLRQMNCAVENVTPAFCADSVYGLSLAGRLK